MNKKLSGLLMATLVMGSFASSTDAKKGFLKRFTSKKVTSATPGNCSKALNGALSHKAGIIGAGAGATVGALGANNLLSKSDFMNKHSNWKHTASAVTALGTGTGSYFGLNKLANMDGKWNVVRSGASYVCNACLNNKRYSIPAAVATASAIGGLVYKKYFSNKREANIVTFEDNKASMLNAVELFLKGEVSLNPALFTKYNVDLSTLAKLILDKAEISNTYSVWRKKGHNELDCRNWQSDANKQLPALNVQIEEAVKALVEKINALEAKPVVKTTKGSENTDPKASGTPDATEGDVKDES